MPHSSGGGSHSGGTHSGTLGSGFSGSYGSISPNNRHRVAKSYYSGANTYVYYDKNGQIQYLYSTSFLESPNLVTIIFEILMLTVILGLIAYLLVQQGLYVPKPIDASSYNAEIRIIDQVGLLEEGSDLDIQLNEFLIKTGVSPAVEIIEDKAWEQDYFSLEEYSYDEYLRLFEDEKHWLVVVSLPENYKTEEFVDWKWEGIIGDECKPVFNRYSEDLFTKTIQRCLLRNDVEYMGKALTDAFESFNQVCLERQVIKGYITLAIMVAVIYFVIVIIIMIGYFEKRVYKYAVRIGSKSKNHNCEYCKNLYVLGTVTKCPACGAPAPAQE